MLTVADIKEFNTFKDILDDMLAGATSLFTDGSDKAIIVLVQGWIISKIKEPDTESVVRGPMESFFADIVTNMSLLRRKIKNTNLKFETMTIGKQAKTKICATYIKDIAKAIESPAKATSITSKIPKVELLDVLNALASKTYNSFIPGIEIEKHEKDKKEMVRLHKTAILNKDKLTGWFGRKEARGLLWVLGKVKSGVIVVKSPKEEDKNVSIEIIRASSNIRPEIGGEK